MIYIIGNPPTWLLRALESCGRPFRMCRDLGEIKTPSIVVLADNCLYVRRCIRISPTPCPMAYPISKMTVKSVLEKAIDTLEKALNVRRIEDALLALGFKEVTPIPYDFECLGVNGECRVGEVYTIVKPMGDRLIAFLARCSTRGLKLYTSIFDLPWDVVYVRHGDLIRELLFLSHIFDLRLELRDRL